MSRNTLTGFGAALAALALSASAVQCGRPETFRSSTGGGGTGGSASISPGTAGVGVAGATGTAGASLAGASGDSGTAGTGVAGTAGLSGAAGEAGATGAAGATGTAGTTGTAGATGTAGTTGAAGTGAAGTTGTAGGSFFGATAGTGGAPDAGTDAAPPGCNCALKVQYECRQNGPSVLSAEYSIKVVNTGTTTLSLANVSVRYWYTIDGSGVQAGVCASATHPCTVSFQGATKPTADQVAVISFAGGTLAPGTDTGEVQVQIYGSGAYNQTNDYSFNNTGANFDDAPHITGYASGKLLWGTPP